MQSFFDWYYPELPKTWIRFEVAPRHIPSYPAVYVIVDRQGVVKYVGQTVSIQQRYKEHARWTRRDDKIGWCRCEASELLFLECWFIATLRPYGNRNQNKRAKECASGAATVKVRAARYDPWKPGARAYVGGREGRIESVNGDEIKINGWWYHKQYVSVPMR